MTKLVANPQLWGVRYYFYCPGCRCDHLFDVRTDGKRPNWSFDGDMDRPTFTPSLNYPGYCHLFLAAGKLQFLSDCDHSLAGQTVDLPAYHHD